MLLESHCLCLFCCSVFCFVHLLKETLLAIYTHKMFNWYSYFSLSLSPSPLPFPFLLPSISPSFFFSLPFSGKFYPVAQQRCAEDVSNHTTESCLHVYIPSTNDFYFDPDSVHVYSHADTTVSPVAHPPISRRHQTI